MKICIAQTKSEKGNVFKNIKNHLKFIERAIQLKADIIVFPELSLTNYEPELASELATNIENELFIPFQKLSDNNNLTIGVGMPTKVSKGIQISMLIFEPNKKGNVYSKQLLHSDELPYFVCGNTQLVLNIKKSKIAIGICYETLQRSHFLNAINKGAKIYIASVAKPKGGIEKAYHHFPQIAKEFNTPILMANSVGYCDNFMSVGQSAIWSDSGKIIEKLDEENQGLLLFDTKTAHVQKEQLIIVKATLQALNQLYKIYLNAKIDLDKQGIYQWTDNYPNRSIIESDLKNELLYVLKNGHNIIGAIHISEEQEPQYNNIHWKFDSTKVLVIHRLVIDPKYQGKGYAKILMDFAENFASENNYSSIRLDVYSKNKKAIDFYEQRKYINRGKVHFNEREFPFYCMEKEILMLT